MQSIQNLKQMFCFSSFSQASEKWFWRPCKQRSILIQWCDLRTVSRSRVGWKIKNSSSLLFLYHALWTSTFRADHAIEGEFVEVAWGGDCHADTWRFQSKPCFFARVKRLTFVMTKSAQPFKTSEVSDLSNIWKPYWHPQRIALRSLNWKGAGLKFWKRRIL